MRILIAASIVLVMMISGCKEQKSTDPASKKEPPAKKSPAKKNDHQPGMAGWFEGHEPGQTHASEVV